MSLFPEYVPSRGEGLWNFLRTSGAALFGEYESGTQFLMDLRNNGYAIAESKFFELRREVLGLGHYTEALQKVGYDNLIPQAYTYDNSGLNLSTEYLYRVKATGTNPMTGEAVEHFFSVGSNQQLTPGQVQEQVTSMTLGEEGFYGINVDRIELFEALKRG